MAFRQKKVRHSSDVKEEKKKRFFFFFFSSQRFGGFCQAQSKLTKETKEEKERRIAEQQHANELA